MKKLLIILFVGILSVCGLVGCNKQSDENLIHKHNIKCEGIVDGYFKCMLSYCEDCRQITEMDIIEGTDYRKQAEVKEGIVRGDAYYIDDMIKVGDKYYD